MIYLRDEETGVKVEDGTEEMAGTVRLVAKSGMLGKSLWPTPEQADALLRGLLRWKLETAGWEGARKLVEALTEMVVAVGEDARSRPAPYRFTTKRLEDADRQARAAIEENDDGE